MIYERFKQILDEEHVMKESYINEMWDNRPNFDEQETEVAEQALRVTAMMQLQMNPEIGEL